MINSNMINRKSYEYADIMKYEIFINKEALQYKNKLYNMIQFRIDFIHSN